jgi:hypothetical protein
MISIIGLITMLLLRTFELLELSYLAITIIYILFFNLEACAVQWKRINRIEERLDIIEAKKNTIKEPLYEL